MKIRVYLKDPDGFSNSVDEAIEKACADLGLDKDETEAIVETRREKVWKQLGKWVEYQEYIGIVFDTDSGTATVEERKR